MSESTCQALRASSLELPVPSASKLASSVPLPCHGKGRPTPTLTGALTQPLSQCPSRQHPRASDTSDPDPQHPCKVHQVFFNDRRGFDRKESREAASCPRAGGGVQRGDRTPGEWACVSCAGLAKPAPSFCGCDGHTPVAGTWVPSSWSPLSAGQRQSCPCRLHKTSAGPAQAWF